MENFRSARNMLLPLLCLLSLLLLFRYFPALLLSVLVVCAVGGGIHVLAKKTARHLHIPQKLCSVIYLLLLIGGMITLFFPILGRLRCEVEELMADPTPVLTFFARAESAWIRLEEKMPWLHSADSLVADGVRTSLREGMQRAAVSLLSGFSEGMISLLSALPTVLLTGVITTVGCFYVALDGTGICKQITDLIPHARQSAVANFVLTVVTALRQYVKAYLWMLLITFGELTIGLLLLRRPYAILCAALIAIVDILPVLGVGCVLLPWAAISALTGEMSLAMGLLILYGVITIVRQIVEPYLLGRGLGLHPLLTLYAMFVALRFFGILGMLFVPVLLSYFSVVKEK